MAALQCEVCGGKLIGKPGGVFECDSCGMEYSTEWAKAKIQEIRGTVQVEGTVEVTGTVKVEGGANKESLLKRGYLLLEDGDWKGADECFDQVLNIDPECAEAFAGKLCAGLKCSRLEEIAQRTEEFEKIERNRHYQKVLRFGENALKKRMTGYLEAAKQEKFRQICQETDRAETLPDLRRQIEILERWSGYQDADSRREECLRKLEGLKQVNTRNMEQGRRQAARVSGMVAFSPANRVGYNIAAAKSDGTVLVTGEITDYLSHDHVERWTEVTAVAMSTCSLLGLRGDGTVLTAGLGWEYNPDGLQPLMMACASKPWTDVVSIACGESHGVGLKADGTVLASLQHIEDADPDLLAYIGRGQTDVDGWKQVIAIAAGAFHTVGLRADGTVVAAGDNQFGQCDVQEWKDIAAVAASQEFDGTVGLRVDGTVVMTGKDKSLKAKVETWVDLVAIAVGRNQIVGLKADGTGIVARSKSRSTQMMDWTDLVAVAAFDPIIGIRKNGTIVADSYIYTRGMEDWRLFQNIDTLEQERAAHQEKRKEARRRLEAERTALQNELANLKGLFSGKRRKEIEARLAAIAKELEE